MLREITLANQPIIRRKLRPVTKFDQALKGLIVDLIDTMAFANGAGLAANQIGSDAQVFVTGIGKPQVFINPKLKILKSRDDEYDEGCLSVPGFRGPVKRAAEVEVTYDDLRGKRRKLHARGFLARALQHEFDHLQGKLYLERVPEKDKIYKVEPVKVVFFGSGEFAVPILISLAGLNWTFDFRTVGVVTQPSQPAGRDKTFIKTAIHQAAQSFNIPVLTPKKLDTKFLGQLKRWHPDLILLADYGKILPPSLLSLPKHGALNLHPSLLPKYRGSAPIQHALLAGEEKTGVTLIKMNREVDAGQMLARYETIIHPLDTFISLRDRLAELGGVMVRDLLSSYIEGKLKGEPQDKGSITPAPKFSPEAGKINLTDPPAEVVKKVRALNPEPGTYTIWQGKRVKILSAHLEEGKLVLDTVQPEGGRVMSYQDFKRGHPQFEVSRPVASAADS